MDAWILIVLLVLGTPIVLAIWLIVRAVQAGRRIEELSRRVGELELTVFHLQQERESTRPEEEPAPAPPPAKPVQESVRPEPAPPPPVPEMPAPEPAAPPPLPPVAAPPPLPAFAATVEPEPEPQRETAPSINWEQFMGVKLFAWVGGLALFLGLAFFVKYSFDNNLVPPELRVAIGFLAGLGLLVGGVWMSRKDYPALSQTLCATGVLTLYAVTFACRSIYHFAFFGPVPTFLLMVLITVTAFLLAVRLNALVVALLGMLGGFLTPILLSTGQDNPLGLFVYIAILDAGLIIVALHRRWPFLTALAAACTVLMQWGWLDKFFISERYFEGNKILIALGVLAGFNALYLAAAWWARRREQTNWWLKASTLGLAATAMAFTGWFLSFEPLALRPWLMFGFAFLIDLGVIALNLLDDEVSPAQPVAGLGVFGLLAYWTSERLSNELLTPALVFYFVFAVTHAAFPVVLRRLRGIQTSLWGSQVFPALALIMVLIPIFKLAEVSFLVWPFVLLVDLLAIVLAMTTATLLPVLAVLVLTLAATAGLILRVPAELTGLPTSFLLLGAFAVFFVGAGVWLTRRFNPDAWVKGVKINEDIAQPGNLASILPALSAVLPFLLLIMATMRLPLADPTPVFGLGLLLTVLLLGLTRLYSIEAMPAIGLVCVSALEYAWHFNRFDPLNPARPLTWYLIYYVIFAAFPFLFLKKFGDRTVPWATAAMAGVPQFFLIHRLVSAAHPNQVMGLLPLAFAVAPLLGLVVVLKKIPAAVPARLNQLAWFGGVALFFITLIFPIQFDRQWITIGWALEGAALLWLFHRVPHPGLRLMGAALLAAAFVRLAFNPAVLEYHTRTTTPILNWYLYAYGVTIACLYAGAQLLAPPRERVLGMNAQPVLASLGTVLAFLLLNIEIADFFSPPGSTLTFQFSGNFARDMTYSIAWALFALGLLVFGIIKAARGARYAALALLSVTLLKLFFHDLAQLGQLYRIGAFIGVAIIAMLASFTYQRFYAARDRKPKEPTTPTEPTA